METLRKQNSLTSWFFLMASLALIIFVALLPFVEGKGETGVASYSRGVLHVNIPYNAELAGAGRLTVEVLDPENKVLGSSERLIAVKKGAGTWKEEIKLNDPVALEDLVWDRVRYSFDYRDGKNS